MHTRASSSSDHWNSDADAKRLCALGTTTYSRLAAVSVGVPGLPRTITDEVAVHLLGVESPSIGDWNTIGVRARVHHTLRIPSHCVIGAGCVVAPVEDEVLGEYTVVYGPAGERRTWSGRGRVQEDDLRRKHWEYLKEMIPKFNRMHDDVKL